MNCSKVGESCEVISRQSFLIDQAFTVEKENVEKIKSVRVCSEK